VDVNREAELGPFANVLDLPIDGVRRHDTRAIQDYLGHKSIQHTVRYTELSPVRFKGFFAN